MKVIAMIPARKGSTRLKLKNLALLNGKPMIYYSIKAALDSGVFDDIYLNSDSDMFKEIADRYGVKFYKRPESLGGSDIKSDDVVADFISNHECDIIAWVNPTSPLQHNYEVKAVVNYFIGNDLDSLITVETKQVHCLFNEEPVNFNFEKIFSQTQDLIPVLPFVYSIMMWKSSTFIKEYNDKGYAFFCGKFGHFPISKESSIIVKTEDDLKLIEHMLQYKADGNKYSIEYDPIVEEYLNE